MANYKDLDDMYIQIKEKKEENDSMNSLKDFLDNASTDNVVSIRIEGSEKSFKVDKNGLAGLINAETQKLDTELNNLLKKVTIK